VVTRARTLRAASAALVLALVPAAGHAAEVLAVLPVADPPGPDAELAARAGELRAALAAGTPGVLAPDALRDRMTRAAAPAELTDLDRAYSGALAAHLAGEFEAANRAFRSVVDGLERLPDGPEVFAEWTRAVLRLARSEQELGREAEARAVLERLLRVVPDLRGEPRQYPPSFLALVEEGRARVAALGTRRLTVETDPRARVFVEGREVGGGPVAALALPPGRYRVSANRMGLRAAPVVVDLAEDRIIRLDLSLADALRPDAGPGLALAGAGRFVRARTAAAQLGLDRIVLVETARSRTWLGEEQRLVATLVDVRGGTIVRRADVALTADGRVGPDALDALAAHVARGAVSPHVRAAGPPALAVGLEAAERILAASPSPAAPPRPSRVAGWAAIGTGALAVAAGVATVVLARDAQASYDDARAMRDARGALSGPHSVAEYNATLHRGDRQRDTAIAIGVAAGVTAATSAVLGYWSWRTTGEIGPLRF
jgi:hypothetical protein